MTAGRKELLRSIRPDMQLTKNFFLRIYGYDITTPGFAEEVLTRMQILGCSKATVFQGYDNMSSILGMVYEANCMVDLYFKKQASDEIYYIESQRHHSGRKVEVVNQDEELYQYYNFERM